MKRLLTFLLFGIIFLLSSISLQAADNERKRYIRMEEVEIFGVVEHPEITYIIPKTKIRFSKIPLERSFADEAAKQINPSIIREEIRIRKLFSGQNEH